MSTTATETPETEIAEASEIITNSPNKAKLSKSQADLERAVALYPEKIRIETIWAQGFCRDACNKNLELLRSVAERLGYKRSWAYFYNALNGHSYKPGKGKGDAAYWLELVAALRKHDAASTASGKLGFIETPTYRAIAQFIDERRAPNAPCKFGVITAPTGTQKTACRRYYTALNNHGKVVGFEAPARLSISGFQRKLGSQYGAKVGANASARDQSLRDNLHEGKTVIIDNAQRLYYPGRGNQQPVFDYVMELQEDRGFTVILIVAEDFAEGDLAQGASKNYFEQLVGRFGGMNDMLRLSPYSTNADLRCIAKAYGLKDHGGAMEYLGKWSLLPGRIRIVFHRLNRAKLFAQADGRNRITLEDMADANEYVPPSIIEDESEEIEGGAS